MTTIPENYIDNLHLQKFDNCLTIYYIFPKWNKENCYLAVCMHTMDEVSNKNGLGERIEDVAGKSFVFF